MGLKPTSIVPFDTFEFEFEEFKLKFIQFCIDKGIVSDSDQVYHVGKDPLLKAVFELE